MRARNCDWPGKMRESNGPDKIPPEFLKHSGGNFRNWLRRFFSLCFQRLVIPKIWRKASVVAILKPKKPVDDPKSYRPISLLCVPFKVLERLLLTPLESILEPALPATQADFRSDCSTVDQIVHLTDDIENGFEERKKAGLVLVDLTAAYDTVWHSGLTLKMLHVIPDRHMVRFLCELLSNRRFTLQTSDGRLSRPRPLKNGVPQGSTLSPLLFNIYISDLPYTQSQQYGYADDLALLYVDKDWKEIEKTLESDMMNISTYLDKWRLKLSTAKTTTTAFHLNNREANRHIKIFVRGSLLPHQSHPTYLGVKLDRQLTYRQHLEGLRSKVSARNSLIRCLAGTSWGAKTSTLRIGALAVAYSAAEYAVPAWCRSKHTRKLDVALNDTMRIITRCLQPTPTECLPVLAGIPPPKLRRVKLTSKFVNKVVASEHHPLHSRIPSTPGNFLPRQWLLSPQPFTRHAALLHGIPQFNIMESWMNIWSSARSRLVEFGLSPANKFSPGSDLSRKEWSTLNCLRTGVGRFNYCLSKWGLRSSSSCSCGPIDQTADHVIVCPLNPAPSGKRGLMQLDEPTQKWLKKLPSF